MPLPCHCESAATTGSQLAGVAAARPLGAGQIIAASGGARSARIGDSHDDAALSASRDLDR
jgi:hypothetical protein